jgi:chromosome condensin MukBEF ATPase and DNA-binding subunit MukB
MSEDIVEKMNRASLAENHLQLKARIEELEAKLAKAMELANLVVEFSDRALWKVAKEVVLELKGEK